VISPISSSSLYELNKINENLNSSLQKMSTGLNINQASDDPAGYAASKMFQKELAASKTQQMNMERQINSGMTASSKLDTASDIVLRMDELTNTASNSLLGAEEKNALQSELNQLGAQLNSTVSSIQGQSYSAAGFNLGSENLVINGSADQLAQAKSSINAGFSSIISENQGYGMNIRSYGMQKDQLAQNQINTQSSLSSIRDADMASETINFTNQGIMQQLAIKSIQGMMQTAVHSSMTLLG
jgi:flagellin